MSRWWPSRRTGRTGTGGGARSARWWSGLGLNLALSLLSLLVSPLTEDAHRDRAILVGSYFAAFLLADSTTTNALGADACRVRQRLDAGTSLRRILLVKNLMLVLVVGLPVLAGTAWITLQSEPVDHVAPTLAAVLGPVLAWLGLGNLASVLLPVTALPLRQRWQQRGDLRSTGRWLAVLGLPWALCCVMDPLTGLPDLVLRAVGVGGGSAPTTAAVALLAGGGLGYLVLTAVALGVPRRRGLRFHDLPTTAEVPLAGSSLVLAA